MAADRHKLKVEKKAAFSRDEVSLKQYVKYNTRMLLIDLDDVVADELMEM